MSDFKLDEEIYIIPHNYTENGKILGVFEKQAFIIAVGIFLGGGFLMFYVLPEFNTTFKMILFFLIFVFPAVVIAIGIGHDSFIDFVKFFLRFNKMRKVYHYEKFEYKNGGE